MLKNCEQINVIVSFYLYYQEGQVNKVDMMLQKKSRQEYLVLQLYEEVL